MSGALQITFQNMRSFTAPAPVPPTVIGQAYGGGYYAGEISTAGNSVADYYLIVGPVASAQVFGLAYKNANTATPGANSVINGPQNTADIVADGNSTVYPAGHFCNDLVVGGFSDWYLPAQNELEVCYYNLKPQTYFNVTNSGINPNAVPARASNYTSGNPAQTSATDFQSAGAERFIQKYWSSTVAVGVTTVRVQYFGSGYQYSTFKTTTAYIRTRAVRRVAIVPTVPTVIGQAFGGGFYAGQISTAGNGIADYYLITGPVASAQSTLQWKNARSGPAIGLSYINGPQNTADIVADGNSTVYPAAHFCNNLSTGGQTDWYMPAKNELEVCYYNLKPTTQANNTSSGINANAVPARASNYTSGTPAQTSAAAFVTGTGAEAFIAGIYWSSSFNSYSVTTITRLYFSNGVTSPAYKDGSQPVRAIRRIAV